MRQWMEWNRLYRCCERTRVALCGQYHRRNTHFLEGFWYCCCLFSYCGNRSILPLQEIWCASRSNAIYAFGRLEEFGEQTELDEARRKKGTKGEDHDHDHDGEDHDDGATSSRQPKKKEESKGLLGEDDEPLANTSPASSHAAKKEEPKEAEKKKEALVTLD